jgi:hypothetical protein
VSTGLAVVAFYLATYVAHRFAVPLGWDSPGYTWRTNLARAVGVGGLPSTVPYPGPVNPGRPGFVVVGGLVSSLTGSDPLRVTAVLPAVMAASAALAWGALVRTVLGWRPVASAFLALFVGTSPFVVHAIGVEGYQDATMALAVFSAAAVPVLVAAGRASGSRAVWPAAILVGAAGTIHWSFLPVIEAILGLCALAFVPAAVRARPRGLGAIVDSPPGRIASIGVLGFALASLWLLVLLPAGLPHAELVVGQLLDKLSRDVPQLGLCRSQRSGPSR